jgi:hypothetical protein
MVIQRVAKFALPLAFALTTAAAQAACIPVTGTVKLLPDATCQIGAVTGSTGLTGECYTTVLNMLGFSAGHGSSGLTNDPLMGVDGKITATPAVLPVNAATPIPRQIVQTARSAITIGTGARKTTLYTSDVITVQPKLQADGTMVPVGVTEQISIMGTDGKGALAGVTGTLVVLGYSVGQSTPVVGRICTP